MKTIAVLVALAAWAHLLFWRPAPWVSWLLFMAFLALGGLFTLAAQAGRLFMSLSDDDLG